MTELNTTMKIDEMGRLAGMPACYLCRATAKEALLFRISGTDGENYLICFKCYEAEKRKAYEDMRTLLNAKVVG